MIHLKNMPQGRKRNVLSNIFNSHLAFNHLYNNGIPGNILSQSLLNNMANIYAFIGAL